MSTRLSLVISLVFLLIQITFSIYFSNKITQLNYQINKQNQLFDNLIIQKNILENHFYNLISVQSLLGNNPSQFQNIVKKFP